MDTPIVVFLTSCFVTLFVVIDPIGTTPVFAALTEGGRPAYRRRMAFRAVSIAAFILLIFAFGGEKLLSALGISFDAFRAAGGILLFMIALNMIFDKRSKQSEGRVAKMTQPSGVEEDVSVFPLAIPLLAGPGAITTVMLFMAQAAGHVAMQAIVVLCVLGTLSLSLSLFLASGLMMQLLGRTLAAMLTRILGVILAALAAQFVFDGVLGVLGE